MKEAIIQYEDTPSGGHLAISWKPLVRCKDCKHGEPCKNGFGEDAIECFDSDICLEVRCRRPDWFCANGERKDT